MSYRDNSFHNLFEEFNGKLDGVSSNKPFAYPGPTQRNLNKDGKFEESKVMQRGYIRSIPTEIYGAKQPVMKANFQFNPSTLQQSVQAQADTLDLIRQDPAQYSTPRPGNANLAFNLKFDRSHELNNYKENVEYTSKNIWSWGPDTVGVYHDIDALYRVIGQGAYADTYKYLKEVVRRRGILSLNDSEGSTIGDWEGGDAGGTGIEGEDDEGFTFDDSLSYLFGKEDAVEGGLINNTAFLIPQPVRLVFSSLFVVEGHVMSSNVTYSRWTPSLVPIMADVSLTIDAKDIGFSRENMLLTSVLKVAAKNAEQEVQEQQDAQQEAVTEALSMISSAQVGIIDLTEREKGGGSDDSWGNTNKKERGQQHPGLGHVLWHLDNKWVDGSTEISGPSWSHLYKSCYLTGGQSDGLDKLKDYFEDGTIKSIKMKYNVSLYGPYKVDGERENRPVYRTGGGGQVPVTLVDPDKTAVESIPLHGNAVSTLFTEQYTADVTATNWDQFQKFFNYKSYHVEGDSKESKTSGLQSDAVGWRKAQNDITPGVNQVSRNGGVPKKGGYSSSSGIDMFPLISGRVNFGSGEGGRMDDDLKDEIYVYKWDIVGSVEFGKGETIEKDVATTTATRWGAGTVADLFDQEHQGTRSNTTSQVGDRRFTLTSNIPLDWVSTAATATVANAPTVPGNTPIRGLPAKSSGNLPRVEAKDGGYARPRSSGSTPRRRDKYLAGIDPNGAAKADKRKKDTPGGTSSTNPNKGGNGPSFPI